MLLTENFSTTAVARLPRGVRPPAVTVYAARSLASFFESTDKTTLVIDLDLGLVRPNAAAMQICQQLGVVPRAQQGVNGMPASAVLPQTADIIGALIDRETFGFAPVLTASNYAEAVLTAMAESGHNYRIVLIAPRHDGEIGEENEYFLQFLAEQSPTLELAAIVRSKLRLNPSWVVTEVPATDAERAAIATPLAHAVAYVPGLLTSDQAAKLAEGDPATAGLLALPNGSWVVPPERRPEAAHGELGERDRRYFAALFNQPDLWLKAYAIVKLQLRPHISALVGFGWRAVTEGGQRVGLALFEAAKRMAPDSLTSAQLDSMIWGTRIGIEDFRAVADVPLPDPALPPRLRGQLLQHKAWGLAMSGKLEEAQTLFGEACALLADPNGVPSREYLYLINITAFTYFRRGQLPEAFRLERQMTDGIARLSKPDQHLEYINCMNTGRLHLHQKNGDEAEHYFERANATNNGLRTLADRLTVHLYRARIAEIRQRTPEVKRHWLRAALAWLSHPLPESLSARAARLMLGQNPPPRHTWFTATNALFTQRLRELFGRALIDVADDVPTICGTERLVTPSAAQVVGTANWCVAISPERLDPPQDHPTHRLLRGLVRAILAEESGSVELANAGTLYVDDQNGTEPAATRDETIGTAIRLGVPQAWFEGEVAYDRDAGGETGLQWSAQLAPSILSVITNASQQTIVAFRRYRAPRVFEPEDDAPIVNALTTGERDAAALAAETGWSQEDIIAILRRLEQDRIVTLRVRSALAAPASP